MKEKSWKKKYIYIRMTALLILAIAGILLYYTTSVQKVTTEQCFSILDDSRDQLSQMIRYEMENEQGHLEAAASLLQELVPDYDNQEAWILRIMNTSNANRNFAHWELCLPDERVIQSNVLYWSLEVNIPSRSACRKALVSLSAEQHCVTGKVRF